MLLLTLSAPVAGSAALADDFLAIDAAVGLLADGRTWTVETPEGMQASLTLNRDGTGTFVGPLTMQVKWRTDRATVCLHLRIAGTRCLRFRPAGNGLRGYEGESLALTLSR